MQTHSTMQALYVAIDVGKNVDCYAAYVGSELAPLVAPTEVRTDRAGYTRFQQWLASVIGGQQYAPIVVGLEPTGVYHESWVHALQADFGDAIMLQLVNPYRTQQQRRQLNGRAERKTDAVDVVALAHSLRDGIGTRLWLPTVELQALDMWCKHYAVLKGERQRLGNRLCSQLERLWPGALVDVAAFKRAHPDLAPPEPLVHTQPLQRKLVQAVLRSDPNPYTWTRLTLDAIQCTLREAGMRCGLKSAQKVQRVARNALLAPESTLQLLVAQLRPDLQRYWQLCDQMAVLRAQAESVVRSTPGAVLATIPGISDFLAAQYVGLVGDVRRFEHADQVWALVGFDTVQDDSGDRRRRGKITKRGLPYGREVLFQMGLSASMACPVIGDAKRRAQARGKSNLEATIHAAHKTNRICFHLYTHGIPFDATRCR